MSEGAKNQWIRIFNEITTHQNSDDENEYMKSMYPKQKSYIPRFALLLNTLYWFTDPDNFQVNEISEKAMLGAEKLSKYFVLMAKKHKLNTIEYTEAKQISTQNQNKSTFEKIAEMLKANPNVKITHMANILGVSRKTIYQHLEKLK
jgi:hypothetical protein